MTQTQPVVRSSVAVVRPRTTRHSAPVVPPPYVNIGADGRVLLLSSAAAYEQGESGRVLDEFYKRFAQRKYRAMGSQHRASQTDDDGTAIEAFELARMEYAGPEVVAF